MDVEFLARNGQAKAPAFVRQPPFIVTRIEDRDMCHTWRFDVTHDPVLESRGKSRHHFGDKIVKGVAVFNMGTVLGLIMIIVMGFGMFIFMSVNITKQIAAGTKHACT